jgi:hypothetical protein
MAEGSEGDGQAKSFLAQTWATLHVSLSRFQTIIGLSAGIISIMGTLLSSTQFFKPAPATGEVVAVVQEAKSQKAVSDARIEILTLHNGLVTTLTPNSLGRARYTLPEGAYRLRVSHPRFGAEVRQVHVLSGQTAEIQVRLRAGSSSPRVHVGRVLSEGALAVRRLFGL